jgi:hypothetical protein
MSKKITSTIVLSMALSSLVSTEAMEPGKDYSNVDYDQLENFQTQEEQKAMDALEENQTSETSLDHGEPSEKIQDDPEKSTNDSASPLPESAPESETE